MIQFVESCHIYHDNGRPIPSVTQVIKAVCGSSYADIPAQVLAKAAYRGTAYHAVTEAYDKTRENQGDYIQQVREHSQSVFGDGIDLSAPFSAYVKVTDGLKWSAIEKRFHFVDGALEFAGTIDRVELNEPWELKCTSSVKLEDWRRQLSFYAIAMGSDSIGGVIHVTKDGKAKIHHLEPCFEDCRALLRVFYLVHYKTWLEEAKKLLAESFHGEMI